MKRSVIAALALLSACHRREPPEGTTPAASSPAPAASVQSDAQPATPLPPRDPLVEATTLPSPLGEAARHAGAHPGYHELLGRVREHIGARFEGLDASSLWLDIATLPDARRAVLVRAPASQQPPPARPLLFIFDAQLSLAWMKDRPTAGLDAGIAHATVSSGLEGNVAVTFYDPPTRTVGMRQWEQAGGLLIDYRVMPLEVCKGLHVIYWPDEDHLVIAEGEGELRAQLISDNGKLRWGEGGRVLASRGALPGATAFRSDEATFTVVYRAAREPSGARWLAQRYDLDGNGLLRAPVELSPAAEGPLAIDALPALERGQGVLEARLAAPHGPVGVDLTDDGVVRLH